MIYIRNHISILKKRINENRNFIQVVSGPRQVGKTTMVNQFLKKYKFPYLKISGDNFDNTLELQWNTIREKIKIENLNEYLIVIDEVQKIYNWREVIKKCWDYDSANNINIKVILLGSSSINIQKGLTESLAGRFEIIFMYHWSFTEMNSAFGWDEDTFAFFGGYPGSAELINNEKRWKDYIVFSLIDSIISKDILMLTRIDKPVLLKNLFELGCQYSGQIISFTKILGQLQDAGNTTTLSHYLDLLNKTGILSGLNKYSKGIHRQRASIPKYQVYNTAMISAQNSYSFSYYLKNLEYKGRIIESAVGAHLLNNSYQSRYEVFYWREGDSEVDFVLHKNNFTIAIEVKSSYTKSLKGIEKFSQQFKPNKKLIISNEGLNWKEFIRINPDELF